MEPLTPPRLRRGTGLLHCRRRGALGLRSGRSVATSPAGPTRDSAFFAGAKPLPVSTVYRKVLYRAYTDSTLPDARDRVPPSGPTSVSWAPSSTRSLGTPSGSCSATTDRVPSACTRTASSTRRRREGAPYNDGGRRRPHRRRGVPPGSTLHLRVAGPRTRRPRTDGRQLGPLDVPLARGRSPRTSTPGCSARSSSPPRNMARPDGTPRDVDREIVTAFAQVRGELELAVGLEPGGRATSSGRCGARATDPNPSETDAGYPWYVKFAINGYIHGSLPLADLTLRQGERVRWYVMSSTNDFDVHAPHWHGNDVLVGGMRTDVLTLLVHGGWASPTWCPTTQVRGCSTATCRSTTRRGWRYGTGSRHSKKARQPGGPSHCRIRDPRRPVSGSWRTATATRRGRSAADLASRRRARRGS